MEKTGKVDNLLWALQEREKELNCLYKIEELINNQELSQEEIFQKVVAAIPPGWQYPDICEARITYDDRTYSTKGLKDTKWLQSCPVIFQGEPIGKIDVYYTEEMPLKDEGPFLKEERKLLNTISERLGHYIMQWHLKNSLQELERIKNKISKDKKVEWQVILDLLGSTDQNLLMRISRKMLNYLCWSGVGSACILLQNIEPDQKAKMDEIGINRPSQKKIFNNFLKLCDKTFKIASTHLSDNEILSCIQRWIKEDKSGFLIDAVENLDNDLTEVANAIRRYYHIKSDEIEMPPSMEKGLRVTLIRRFFTDQLEFINIGKHYIEIKDFYDLVERTIFPINGYGKVGGKSAGLFLASQIINKSKENAELFSNFRIPKTWYITSDGLIKFLKYNSLEDVIEQKYKDIEQIRQEYQQIVQVFKSSYFPPEIINGLSMALDHFEEKPIIVRSSSLLEDRAGSAFSGKYKSLFLANQGSKQERLEALTDAISEIYASTFGPDPIEYRAERGLLDFHEEMGIMIQEVVGTKVGIYFLPAFGGVAFSNNEFRWSGRIKREDGLIRMVPGLGTRAVDRLSDDYPVLIAPGQPGLRANVTVDEIVRYSPKKIDVINLETNTFETIEIKKLFHDYGDEFPKINHIVSIFESNHIRKPIGFEIDFDKDNLLVTFEGLITDSIFIKQMQTLLKLLKDKLGTPVDIEFASDGKNFYLLQCRPQSYSIDSVPSPIPEDVAENRIVFSAHKYISNGKVPDITHIVYVDPLGYSELTTIGELNSVGRAVGRLNKILPKRQFILMGPGRWGSRGDVNLGVNVTYSDINNTAVLIEIARKKGNYVPDLSFGTHFFQDLVEGGIRYLPLYPDDEDIIFNNSFLTSSYNILPDVLPEFANLSGIIRVIDVPKSTGMVLRILMNAEIDKAIGLLTQPSTGMETQVEKKTYGEQQHEDHWRWRLHMAEKIASHLSPGDFGVKAFYIFGSTKNATAGPGSDIDILIHFRGDEIQKQNLMVWLEGWSICLGEMNFLRTGYKSYKLLDVHLVTDEDIMKKTSYAVKIGAVTDAAREIALKRG